MKFDLWATLRTGRPALAVAVEAPSLTLARTAQGRWNWLEALPKREGGQQPLSLPVALAHITLVEGVLNISDGLAATPPAPS